MRNPLVSIIVPVHNCESTIRQCVGSLLSQTYDPLEIILVENGSCDGSLDICSQLKHLSHRVSVFSTGVADVMHARNFGIEESNGAYVAFCDSDDWYRPFAIEQLVTKAKEFRVPIVKAGYDKVIAPGIPAALHRSYATQDKVLKRSEWCYGDYARFYNPLRYPFSSSLSASLYERELVLSMPLDARDNGLRRGEDLLLNAYLLEGSEAVASIPDRLYCYRLGGVTSGNERLVEDLICLRDKLDTLFSGKVPLYGDELAAEFDCYLLSVLLKRYQNCSHLAKRDIVGFYRSLAEDERIACVARRVSSRSGGGTERLIARLLVEHDAGGLYELARSRYWIKRLILKTGNKASSLFAPRTRGR